MTQLVRFPDWPVRLTNYMRRCAGRAYEPGTHDCCTFAAGAIEAMTGIDPMASLRGAYATEEGFGEVLRAHGWRDLRDAVAALVGPPTAARNAYFGDLLWLPIDNPERPLGIGTLGVYLHNRAYIPGANHIAMVRFGQVVSLDGACCFRVGT